MAWGGLGVDSSSTASLVIPNQDALIFYKFSEKKDIKNNLLNRPVLPPLRKINKCRSQCLGKHEHTLKSLMVVLKQGVMTQMIFLLVVGY